MKNENSKRIFSSRTAKGLVIIVAVLLIGVAVYLNYRWFYDPTDSLGYGDSNMEDTFGDGTNKDTDTVSDYFAAAALTRQQSRDEAIDVLKLVANNEEASAEAKAEAQAKISQIAVDIQNEANIETLVKAKGFEECVAVISENSASVIVKAESLQANEAAQIMAIVYETAGILPENVTIVNK